MKSLSCLPVVILLSISLSAAPKFPFPHNVAYKYGILPKDLDHNGVQKAYEDFLKLYKEEGDLARICHDDVNNTVSEGIAYGMIVMVYMDNDSNKTQPKFDKLWNYYKKYMNGNGLMNWKISGFGGVTGSGPATDAEVDAALALLQAYKQWGDEKYMNDAKNLIGNIARCEVNGNGFLKPGEWDNEKNPSYFSIAALELFKQAGSYDWGRVISNSYNLIKKSQNQTTGLVPNWCNEQGIPSNPSGSDPNRDKYTYDATRTPWRIAWAYSWYGHQDAKDICTKIASWISEHTDNDAKKIMDGYKLDGSAITEGGNGKFNNATFVGPFTCAGMVDAVHQDWVDKGYAHLDTMKETVYYQIALKLLTMLYLSGNMPNMWDFPKTEVTRAPQEMNTTNDKFMPTLQASATGLSFTTTEAGKVKLSLYTVSGKHMATLVNRVCSRGNHRINFSHRLSAGTYLVNVRSNNGVITDRLVIP